MTLTDDFLSAAWRKLALNSAGVVNAAETILVGNAVGARVPDTLPDEVVTRYVDSAPDSVNSLLADRLANRPMELDARNGIVVRLGAEHGIATPLNAMAVALLGADLTDP